MTKANWGGLVAMVLLVSSADRASAVDFGKTVWTVRQQLASGRKALTRGVRDLADLVPSACYGLGLRAMGVHISKGKQDHKRRRTTEFTVYERPQHGGGGSHSAPASSSGMAFQPAQPQETVGAPAGFAGQGQGAKTYTLTRYLKTGKVKLHTPSGETWIHAQPGEKLLLEGDGLVFKRRWPKGTSIDPRESGIRRFILKELVDDPGLKSTATAQAIRRAHGALVSLSAMLRPAPLGGAKP